MVPSVFLFLIMVPVSRRKNLPNLTVLSETSKLPDILFGLPSINHRIALLYGENYGLTIESSPEKGTTVTIVIPDKKI